MKKLYKLGLGVIFASLLVACSDDAKAPAQNGTNNTTTEATTPVAQDEVTSTYELEQPGVTIRITLVGKDDKITRQETDSIIAYDAIGATNAEEAEQILSAVTNNIDYAAIKGITYDMTYGDKEAHETIIIDLTKADLAELAELPGSAFNGDPNEGVSYSATGQLLETAGFKKVK
ncbi:hypothetical protein DC083_02650 [Ignatzschineria ureiclastica]|uniref:DUF1307 domain-containing protein n=1 Tax=Ignatzschineria ureiclastica TaxID=472582 RepID=A0A2U2AHG0_9GAMM|nr:DUF1307 domain-containing protein [Ignatzschineria ureiclastica]PWD82098.1 hypothetical protein DC083_02650 [Ignatzschineria ureiclastica]GGZ92614.1 hypothetical protein GCM10007162_05160 [Ignatzschineria ureiclastica]